MIEKEKRISEILDELYEALGTENKQWKP